MKTDMGKLGKKTQFKSGGEAAKKGAIGGVKSGEVRREKRKMREAAEMVLGLKPNISQSAINLLRSMGVSEEITMQTVALVKIMEKAMKGDIAALQFIRDTAGQKPTDKVDLTSADGPINTRVKIVIKGPEDDEDDDDDGEK